MKAANFSQDEWPIAKDIFNQAIELPPAKLTAFIHKKCRGQPELLDKINAVIKDYLPIAEHTIKPATTELGQVLIQQGMYQQQQFGKFHTEQLISAGTMGHVYIGQRTGSEVQQQVAIKVFAPGVLDQAAKNRFRNEQQILASLEHPGIARLIDVGEQNGLSYFVMEYVDGLTLDAYCSQHQLTIKQRLTLFKKICEVVSYAHSNLIVHRDLKPYNIMVLPTAEIKLLDFGIAKPLADFKGQVDWVKTAVSEKALTPKYAAPEQFFSDQVTTACDVYALGVVLYELLTGQAPLDFSQLSWSQIEQVIKHDVPDLPSQAVLKHSDRTNPQHFGKNQHSQLAAELRGDLDQITMHCLKKHPTNRYHSVAHLHQDLERLEHHHPIAVSANHKAYKLRKFLRRNWLPSSALGLIMLVCLVAIVAINQQKNRALEEQAISRQVLDFMVKIFSSADPSVSLGSQITAAQLLSDGKQQIMHNKMDQAIRDRLLASMGEVYHALGEFSEAEELVSQISDQTHDQPFDSKLWLLKSALKTTQEEYQAALTLLQSAAAALPDNDPLLIEVWHGMAARLKDLDQRDQALSYTLRSNQLSRQLYGTNSIEHAISIRNHARILSSLGDIKQAVIELNTALQVLLAHYPEHHPEVALTLKHLTIGHRKLKNTDQAYAFAQRTHQAYLQTYGHNHVVMASVENLLGTVYKQLQDHESAINHYLKSLTLIIQYYGQDSVKTAAPLYNLGTLYLNGVQQPQQAIPYLKQAIQIVLQHWGAEHNNYHFMRLSLAKALLRLQRHEASEPILRACLSFFAQQNSRRGLNLAITRSALAYLQLRKGDHSTARQLLTDALPVLQQHLKADDADLQLATATWQQLQ